ncbi:MAG: type II secretion system F family protein [Nocardioidaceae bacterium]|nr:type II secretion system F family protein [Nocardioidaceae bacterium]
MSPQAPAATVCLTAAAGAAWLLVPGRPGLASRRRRAGTPLVVLALVLPAVVLGDRSLLVLLAIAAATGAVGLRLWRRRSNGARAVGVRMRVVELCEALQVELGAGQAPADALALAAGDWPEIEPAARTARSGGDVPAALRRLSTTPGAGDLRVVAAAWQVAHRTGHGLADAVGRVATELREAERTRRVVAGELASARATARLVACLPVAALLLGTGAGSDPWSFLFGRPLGWACLAGGLAFGLAGLTWIEALATGVERDR